MREAKGDEKYIKCSQSCKDCLRKGGSTIQGKSCAKCGCEFREIVDKRILEKPSTAEKAHYMIEIVSVDMSIGVCVPCYL